MPTASLHLTETHLMLLVASIANGWAQIRKGLPLYDPTTDQLLKKNGKTNMQIFIQPPKCFPCWKILIDPNVHYEMSHMIPCPLIKSLRIESEFSFHCFMPKERWTFPQQRWNRAEKSHLASSIPPNPKHITQWQHSSFHRISTQALLQLCKHSTLQCMLFACTHLEKPSETAFLHRWNSLDPFPSQQLDKRHLAMIQEEHLSAAPLVKMTLIWKKHGCWRNDFRNE